MHKPRERLGRGTLLMDAVGDEPIHVTEAQRAENDVSHDRLAPADRIERQCERMVSRYLVVPRRTDE
jgi:hypothetical protein